MSNNMDENKKSKKIIVAVVLTIVSSVAILILVLLYRVGGNVMPKADIKTQEEWLEQLSQTSWVLDEGSEEVYLKELLYAKLELLKFDTYDDTNNYIELVAVTDYGRQTIAYVLKKEDDVLEFNYSMQCLPLYYREKENHEVEKIIITGEENRLIYVRAK